MKQGIHPEYYKTIVRCACGNEFESGSTVKEISVEICSKCHPFFTGKQKLVDSAGRVERLGKNMQNSTKKALENNWSRENNLIISAVGL